MMRRVLPLVVLIVATNLVMLASVRANRAGNPDVVVMTERELPQRFSSSDRDSALKLRLHYEEALGWQNGREREVLAALGFRCASPTPTPVWRRCGLARRAFAALEFDGPAWQARAADRTRERDQWLEKARQGDASARSQAENLDSFLKYGTRLILVDASLDAAALRRAHPDRRVIILPAVARAWLTQEGPEGSTHTVMTGTVEPLVSELIVPVNSRNAVPPADRTSYRFVVTPRYTVALIIGRHHEPWIERVTAIDSPEAPR